MLATMVIMAMIVIMKIMQMPMGIVLIIIMIMYESCAIFRGKAQKLCVS